MVANLLSKTSKMPCFSISLDARLCHTGSKLAKIPNTPCHKCYALRGFYRMPNTVKAMEKRLHFMTSSKFIPEMVRLLTVPMGHLYFRWFDSGDIQSKKMGNDILSVVKQTPYTMHWLPSKEYGWWRNIMSEKTIPHNVSLRISTPIDDQAPSAEWFNTSTTYTSKDSPAYTGYICPAHIHKELYGKYECRECRACWNPSVKNIAYIKRYESKTI